MRIPLFLASAVILGLVPTTGALADDRDDDDRDGGQQAFVGLWQAIDSLEGSTQYLSITCSRRSECDVRLNDTSFTDACKDKSSEEIPEENSDENSDENLVGFAHGVGWINRNVLSVELTLYCDPFDPKLPDDPDGTQENEFVLDRRNGTLTNFNDDSLRNDLRNVFHRISK